MEPIYLDGNNNSQPIIHKTTSYGSLEQEMTIKAALNGLLMLSKKPSDLTKKDSLENISQNQAQSIFLTPCASPIPGNI
jgi:hypothetical protein